MNNPAQQAVPVPQPIRYCLYSRKSTEQDEQQSLSIESQVKEMLAAAGGTGFGNGDPARESLG